MHRTALPFFIAIIVIAVSSQTVDLNGTVSNKNGKPIIGAIITLSGQKLSDTTDEKGAYTLSFSKVALSTLRRESPVFNVRMNKGVVRLHLTDISPVRIETFDMQGNLLKKAAHSIAVPGDYQYDLQLQRSATSLFVVRITIGTQRTTFRYLPFQNVMSVITSEGSSPSLVGELSKIKAVVDTMKISASGYLPKETQISSYQGTVNVTLDSSTLEPFSFFVTSLKALQDLSGSQNGFGGDFRFGKTGAGSGLKGADSICQCIAERSMPGSRVKQWRAFLSVTADENGKQVNAIDRIGAGPWYDRLGRLLAPNLADLKNTRPMNGDPTIQNDLPNEDGIPNHRPDPTQPAVDNHHMVTGSKTDGTLYSATATCSDWTSTTASGKPRCGFAWPRGGMGKGGGSSSHWISGFDAGGCGAGIQITEKNDLSNPIIGAGGGYGGFYCFALTP